MNDLDTNVEHTLPEREQAILDTALLESDQLLARSLHGDQSRRRRRFWLLVLLFGGAAMSGLLFAIYAGWLIVGGQVTADPGDSERQEAAQKIQESPETKQRTPEQKQEDMKLQQRILAATDDDPWHVGANIGMDLVRIPGDRPYQLLKTNWKKIAANAKKQILKGFTPGMMGNKKMHSRFFDVMHLGMSDKNPEVRNYAVAYLKMQGLSDFEHDLAAYKSWRKKTEKLSAQEIMKLVGDSSDEPQSSEALTAAGWELWKVQKFSSAIEKFEAAVKLDPKAVNAWNGLGWALFNSGRGDEALPAFQKCIKLMPRHPAGLNGLGQVYFSRGNYKQAEKYLKKAAPRAPAAWWGLTKVYLLTEKYKQAVPWAEKVAASSPDDPWARRMLEDAKAGKLSDELRQIIEPIVESEDEQQPDSAVEAIVR